MTTHHGTPGGYTNQRCRRDCCRKAWAEYTKLRRRAQREAMIA